MDWTLTLVSGVIALTYLVQVRNHSADRRETRMIMITLSCGHQIAKVNNAQQAPATGPWTLGDWPWAGWPCPVCGQLATRTATRD